jgi:hypothetical protein
MGEGLRASSQVKYFQVASSQVNYFQVASSQAATNSII